MRRIRVKRPSPALVIACVALGFGLAGTSVAAVSQLAPNSVGAVQLRNGAVTNAKLRNRAVTSAKVANRSLLRADFAPGQLPAGPTGPQGPAGAPGPAGPAGAPGLSAVERVEMTSASNTTTTKTAFIACPSGKRLIGGGARLNGTIADDVAIQQSFPDNDNIYRARAAEIVATGGSWSLTVFAICATVAA
jgi:hypothetical protein